jgi:hypothetical protein
MDGSVSPSEFWIGFHGQEFGGTRVANLPASNEVLNPDDSWILTLRQVLVVQATGSAIRYHQCVGL